MTTKGNTMDIPTILTRKYPGMEWTLDGDDYTGLTWLSDTPKPTKSALEKAWPEVVAEIEAEKQAREDAKASALAKLEALGLTADEVREVFGIGV
jgi:hypothetical protein